MKLNKKTYDARKVDLKTKKAVLLKDLLGDDDEKDKDKEITEELTGIPQPPGEELTPVRRMPGAPRGLGEEVEEEYTPLSAEEIEKKREEAKPPVELPAEPGKERPRTFRDIMQDKLRKETPEGKKEEAMLEKYGPTENIKEVIDTLTPYTKQLAEVDIETAKTIIERSALPDILKERAEALFTSFSPGDLVKAEQLALNLLGAGTRKQVEDAEEWLRDDPEGQQYALKALEMHRTRRVMNMLSNTILAMEGEAVILQPPGKPRLDPQQRAEKKRLEGLIELLNAGRITNPEFEDAKRKGMTADEVVAGWAIPPKESLAEKVEREYREEERRKEEERKKGGALRLNMKKKALEWEPREPWQPEQTPEDLVREFKELNPEFGKGLWGILNSYWDNPNLPIPPDVLLKALDAGQAVILKYNGEYTIHLLNEFLGEDMYITPPQALIVHLLDSNKLVEIARDGYDVFTSPTATDKVNDVLDDITGKRSDSSQAFSKKLNFKKAEAEGDVTGPGGPAWEYEWTSGLTPTKDTPQKRKRRFPFYNKPSPYTPGEGDQGNLHDVGPKGGQPDMNYLANAVKSMTKTADNDMFEIYSLESKNGWLTCTLFKKAHSKFRPGDIVVQYGSVPAEYNTYRRRYGSIASAKISLVDALRPILVKIMGND